METTGFTDLFQVKKRLKSISVDGCPVIGQGGNGGNYGTGGHNGGDGGIGVTGTLKVSTGSAIVNGGNGGSGNLGGKVGHKGQAVTDTITLLSLDTIIEESDDNRSWSAITSEPINSDKQFVRTALIATISSPPIAQNLTYNSSDQELVTPGRASGGTMKYTLGIDTDTSPDDSDYNESIPTAADAATYYVRALIAETKNYQEAVSEPMGFTINQKSATVTASDQTIKEGESIETGIDKASLSEALTDHSLSAVKLDVQNGEILPSDAEIRDAAGKDVTKNYNISYQPGTLTVIKKISQTVTFRVVNGFWNDGSKDDKTVTLEGHEGDTLKLALSDIPNAGNNPNDNYRAGDWDTAPDTETAISEDTIYTYSYIKKDPEPEEKKASAPLLVKMTAKGKNNLKLSWTKVKGAQGYDIFFGQCSHGKIHTTVKKIQTVKAGAPLIRVQKGLRKNTAYKARIKAYVVRKGKKQYIKSSPAVHAYTSGYKGNYTNPKSVKVNRPSLSLTPGKTVRIKAKVTKLKKGKKLIPAEHAARLRYLTTNTNVATVNKSGKITAKSQGSCKIYVYTVNGLSKTVKITVK